MSIFNEDTRVKIPATIHFLRLGYDYQSLKSSEIDFNTKIFKKRFKKSIEKINGKCFSEEEIEKIISKIDKVIKNNDLGREFYNWIINPLEKVKLIDFENIENNDFAIVDELSFNIVEGTNEGSFRPDINILINGIPLAFLEVKKPNNEGGIQKEFNRMINKRIINPHYKKFFNMIQIVSFSNNMEYEEDNDDTEDVKAGSFYTTPNGENINFSFFREDDKYYHENYRYKKIDENIINEVIIDCGYKKDKIDELEFKENMDITTPCNRFITSIFDKERFLYLIKYGIMYINEKVLQKHIMRYPQFFATRRIIERLENGGKGGIIWHTQGSGKTALVAFSNRIIKDYYAKKNINARFFFVVDRLDLLRQASTEFINRGIKVTNCNNKASFTKELNKPLSTNVGTKSIGEICVVNIQKFEGEIPTAKNDYNANIQRVFFIDEAHRSYSSTGEFFKNLMTCDMDAIYIALTGTPILSKKERSNLKFGDYIHKYFYDKSIADGYTLRIKKENIDTVARKEIKRNLEIEENKLNDKIVYESDSYIDALGKFIETDFKNFRYRNTDNTIGGMIVCRTNVQAKKVHEWFEKNSNIKTGLVITDENNPEQKLINRNNQINFRESYSPDILVVNYMLTTGYDVKRLKKMYLLRGPHAQSLLQTISRVNRPYKSPNGKVYKYGYIVDFVDIAEEYDRTIEAYIKELEEELNENGENEGTLDGLIIDKEAINNKYQKYVSELEDIISIDNLEKFSKKLTMYNKETLLKIKRILNGIKECQTEFILSRASEYLAQIDSEKNKKLLRATQDRIDFINLSENTVETLDAISDEEVVKIIYEFIKVKISVMNLGEISDDNPKIKIFSNIIKTIQKEIKENKNKDDIRIKKLDDILRKIFNNLSISDLDDLDNINDELLKVLQETRKINEENKNLAAEFGNNYAFVKTYQHAIETYICKESDIKLTLKIVYEAIKDSLENSDVLDIQGRKNFVDSVKSKITKQLIIEKIYSKVRGVYEFLLIELYNNLKLFK